MFIIKSSRKRGLALNEPLRHESHRKPVSRRDFIAQGFLTGSASVMAPAALGMLLKSRAAEAGPLATTPTLGGMRTFCDITGGNGKIPFIAFDLAGGSNIVGSNVLVGKKGGQLDFLTTQGYSKQGLPGDMLPTDPAFVNQEYGLAFHADSPFLRGMNSKTSITTRAMVNGFVIPARSENDTSNNPHNPMYYIAKAGAKGELLTLIGSQNSDSGGNSMAPSMLMDPANRPTKVDRASDVTGLVDTGDVANILSASDTSEVLQSMVRVSDLKSDKVSTQLLTDAETKKRYGCSYVKTADTVSKFSDPQALNPGQDPKITAIFGANFGNDNEFQKTASVMKLVVQGNAGAGTITIGGCDYHTGDRMTGERRDFRTGQSIGAVLEYAAQQTPPTPVFIYVFSDGSLSSNGMVDNSTDGRGKGVWTGDNQQTAAAFVLVYNPTRKPTLLAEDGIPIERRQQLGYFRPDGDVETAGSPAANNVNLLVQTVALNYMALHGEDANFSSTFAGQGLGDSTAQRAMVALTPICNGKITTPV